MKGLEKMRQKRGPDRLRDDLLDCFRPLQVLSFLDIVALLPVRILFPLDCSIQSFDGVNVALKRLIKLCPLRGWAKGSEHIYGPIQSPVASLHRFLNAWPSPTAPSAQAKEMECSVCIH